MVTTSDIRSAVDWQGVSEYVTKAGKTKEIVTGIPTSRFWRLWKACKDELKALGLTVKCGGAQETGEYRQSKGVKYPVKRKQWEVTLWVNPRNRNMVPELIETNCPF